MTSLPCSSRLVLLIGPLSPPPLFSQTSTVPPALTSSGLCWETKNVQASVFRRNKDMWCQHREECPRRHIYEVELWSELRHVKIKELQQINTQSILMWIILSDLEISHKSPILEFHTFCTSDFCVLFPFVVSRSLAFVVSRWSWYFLYILLSQPATRSSALSCFPLS